VQIHGNPGIMHTNLIGDLPGYSVVWFHIKYICKILSLANVKNKHKVTYDNSKGNQFVVHNPHGSTCIFKQSSCGLYHLNFGKESVALVNTVEDKNLNIKSMHISVKL